MNQGHNDSPPSYWTGYTKPKPYSEAVGGSWAHMDSSSNGPLPHYGGQEVGDQQEYYNTGQHTGSDVSDLSYMQEFDPIPFGRHARHIQHIQPVAYHAAVPSFMEYQGRVPPGQQYGPRCISQPGHHNTRMYDERPRSERNESTSPIHRRPSEYADDMDLALFVEATSGFIPESPMHQRLMQIPPPPPQQQPRQQQTQWVETTLPPAYPVSPLASMSHTRQSWPDVQIRHPQPQVPAYSPQRGLNVWQQRLDMEPLAWQAHDYGDDPPPADELPNYAQSQAEVQNKNRTEAKRRAEELQRSWRQRQSR